MVPASSRAGTMLCFGHLAWTSHGHRIQCFIELGLGDVTTFDITKRKGRLTNGDLLIDRVLRDLSCGLIADDLIQRGDNRWGRTGKERSAFDVRSEERRVGNERGPRWAEASSRNKATGPRAREH